MKIFAVITIFALLGGSNAFLGTLGTLFHNLEQELGSVGKDLLHTAEPIATSLLQTLEKAGTQLLTTAASDLLSHLGTTTAGKRGLGETISQVGSFVNKAEDYFESMGGLLTGVFKGTVAKIQSEIEKVTKAEKPLNKLIDEVKSAVEGHNNFVNDLISKAEEEGIHLLMGHDNPKRNLTSTASSFAGGLKDLLQKVAAPLKSALGETLYSIETKVLGLLGQNSYLKPW